MLKAAFKVSIFTLSAKAGSLLPPKMALKSLLHEAANMPPELQNINIIHIKFCALLLDKWELAVWLETDINAYNRNFSMSTNFRMGWHAQKNAEYYSGERLFKVSMTDIGATKGLVVWSQLRRNRRREKGKELPKFKKR